MSLAIRSRFRNTITLIFATILPATLAKAEIFVTPLPGLLGSYPNDQTDSFDFGTRFSSITTVTFEYVSYGVPEIGYCPGCEPPDTPHQSFPSCSLALFVNGGPGFYVVFPDSGFSSGSILSSADVSELLDGRGEIRCLGPGDGIGCGCGGGGWIVTQTGVTDLFATHLIIDGDRLKQGDMNGDGRVDGSDVQEFVSVLLEPSDATVRERLAADCNYDEVVDQSDVPYFVALLLTSP